ncbi:MMPL family transporter [Paenibacillus qinlingensis]|uniref:RND superfamily putative drug exporter n=1 Tax=Paenibacillus qinlingensis TaxID=1837343 RepID=A0ABU1NN48_9BACL|nr:MMPL family transporter [Paenibacillus qinlingensis]MDR6548895.1 RND superfamily putative drug exporter [Paenibacillus qinlingensis]
MHENPFFSKIGGLVAGRRSKWVTLAVWILLTGLLSVLLPNVNSQENNAARQLPTDSWSLEAAALMKEQFPSNEGVPALVVWYRGSGLTDQDLAAVQKVTKQLTDSPLAAQKGLPPLHQMPAPALKGMVSKDGKILVLPISFNEGTETEVLQEGMKQLEEITVSQLGSDPFEANIDEEGLHARITGPVGIQTDATALFKGADFTLLLATVLLVLVLLILLYRSPILAIIPLVGVGFAYGVISPILGFMAKQGWITVDAQSISIMTVLLFGAGTDYCLFFVARYRQALLEEKDKYSALRVSFGGSTGAIGMSGLTVIVSLLGLLFAHYGSNHRFAIPFSVAIFIMALASLTLVPALLAIIGRVSFFPFIPLTAEMRAEKEARKGKRMKEQKPVGALNAALGRVVTEKPKSVLAISLIILIALAAFAPQIKFTYNILESFPSTMASREGFSLLAEHVSPGSLAPVKVVVNTEGKNADVQGALAKLSYVESVSKPEDSKKDANYKAYELLFKQDPYDLDVINRIPEIRNMAEQKLVEAGVASPQVWVGGETATQYDTKTVVERDTKIVIPVVITVIAILLLVYLRSIVATVYLIATVLLSYYSALGAGWLILHYFMDTAAIQGLIPLYAFVFLVALGEDYNIFMISSIWQERNRLKLKDAIRLGVSSTSSVITSAGLILAGTFAVLASLPIQVLVQFGVICAVGVILDTFIVRPFLVPSITMLLGDAVFWPSKVKRRAQAPASDN